MSDESTNRVTEYRYNADGRLSELIVWCAGTGDQRTMWEYGTTLEESGVASNELVRAKVYPEDVEGSDRVAFCYNRLGQMVGMRDQNGTEHAYGYDGLGRLIFDQTPTLGSSVDGEIRQIIRSFNPSGWLSSVVQSDENAWPDPSVMDEVKLTYNGFGQITVEEQSHSGAVTASTPKVSYSYANGSLNTVRLESVTYPDGRVLSYYYGAAGSIDDLTDRISEIRDNGIPLVRYIRRGIDSTVEIEYVQPRVRMTYLRQSGMPLGDAGDEYTGLDRFNRIEDIRWMQDGEDVDRYQYGFDRASERTWRCNVTAPDTTDPDGGWSEAYAYDGMRQLTSLGRGDLNLNQTWIAAIPKWQEDFTYDAAGNWKRYQTAIDGAGTLDQVRQHNRDNEITAINGSPATVGYDGAGNMTTMPQMGGWGTAQTLVWDAWNRLVKVSEGATEIGRYRYDGLTRRIWKQSEENEALIERHFYYSDQWQVLEERVGESTNVDRQFVWGTRYIDDLVMRERFEPAPHGSSLSSSSSSSSSSGVLEWPQRLYATHDQWHCTALLDEEGSVVERYAYTAFGESIVLTPDYAALESSAYEWETRFGAYRFDLESNLYQVRFRYLHPTLGRWLSRDPLGERVGVNLYAYIENNATNAADSFGLQDSSGFMRPSAQDIINQSLNRMILEDIWKGTQKEMGVKEPKPLPPPPPAPPRYEWDPDYFSGIWHCHLISRECIMVTMAPNVGSTSGSRVVCEYDCQLLQAIAGDPPDIDFAKVVDPASGPSLDQSCPEEFMFATTSSALTLMNFGIIP